MADLRKSSFKQDLDKYQVLVQDTDPNSKYFKITELSDTLTGGKNAFLVAGSEYLVPDTLVRIEIKDAKGNVIYNEPGEGMVSSSVNGESFVTEYYEGTSKIVAIYVYPDTAYGPCTITILGELSSYDSNGTNIPTPSDWQGAYNVKWQKQINVNPLLPNTTKIRFYRRPQVNITEVLSPVYRIESGSKYNSGVYQSFANIKLSQLETFAGDVKRVKVFRTSQGDISDYDLIQDILVESKELLTTYDLTSSVVGNTGIFNQQVLTNFWNTGSLKAELTSSRIENGVKLSGSGLFIYTQSLDLISANTYELNLDAFYSSSVASDMVVYVASGSISSSITTLSGIIPTKNLSDNVVQFKLDSDYISSSLYFSQSRGEWHLGNISLKLAQDTAFSPDQISFVTTMPTIIGNETYNFKFEFYDVNNNYVPVYVTQSAQFTGGTNFNNIILAISSSASGSLSGSIDYVNHISQSISGTAALYLTTSVATASVFYTSSIQTSSLYLTTSIATASYSASIVSASVYTLSGSVRDSLTIVSGGITLLSGSFLQFTQSYYSTSASFDNRISQSISSSASQSLYQVYSASQYLDTFIFTDQNGKINQPPTASSPGLYLGSSYLGYFSGSGTSGWKTYMDDQGDFYLTGSNNNFLAWSGQLGTLQVQGNINIQDGNGVTTSSLNTSASALLASASLYASVSASAVSTSLAPNIFTDSTGKIVRPPTVLVGSSNGLFLGSDHLGYYSGSDWKTYMDNTGKFYLTGSDASNYLKWDGSVLTIAGAINLTGGNAQTQLSAVGTATGSLQSQLGTVGGVTSSLQSQLGTVGTVTSSLQSQITTADNKIFTDALGRITKTPSPGSTAGLYLGSTNLGYYNGAAWKTYMDNTGLFYLTGSANGNALIWDGANLTIRGTIKVGGGQEVTSDTITNASTALQSGQTGKSLGLSGGSVGGVTIASDKIYVGTGTYGNTNTGFYVDSSGNMSLKDKLTWDSANSTLTVTGKIVITDGNAATTSSLDSGLAGKINTGGAATDVNNNSTKISGGKITAGSITANEISSNTITANEIASLNFYSKTAKFDTGDIGGWTINSSNLNKIGSTHTMTLDSANNVWKIVQNTNNQLRVAITGSTTIPAIQTSYTDTITFTGNGANLADANASIANQYVNVNNPTVYLAPSSGRGDDCSGAHYYGTGVIGLIYPTEEIWVDTSEITPGAFTNCLDINTNDGYDDYVYARYQLQLRVRRYSNCTDAVNDVNVQETWTRDIAYLTTYINFQGGSVYLTDTQTKINDCAIQVNANNTYYRVDLVEGSDAVVSTGGSQFTTTHAYSNRFNGNIVVRFGRVDNGYSVFGPGGLQVYQGVKSYLNASTPAGGSNFFEVKGKSSFLSGLYVSGTLSATDKQFQITHPLDDKKWLYHMSTESPRADLIYRGKFQLENGQGTASIDSASNMTMGTFDALTKNSQLFLQNNESFDRVKGKVENGNVYVLCENQNSTASIDWTVIAERNDNDLRLGSTYFNGKYKIERYKSEFADEIRNELEAKISGSI